MAKVELTCPVCGIIFSVDSFAAKTRRCCSRKCANASRSPRSKENNPDWKDVIERTCGNCGKVFCVPGNNVKHSARKYCSAKCYRDFSRAHPETTSLWAGGKKVEFVCVECGIEFTRRASWLNLPEDRNAGRYCSRSCQNKARARLANAARWTDGKTPRVQRVCEGCGNTFDVPPWIACIEGYGRFCSIACKWKIMRAENHPGWKGGGIEKYPPGWKESLRAAIRDREGHRCFTCSKEQIFPALCVHHIDYNPDNLKLSNLVALCRSCHNKTNHNRHIWEPMLSDMLVERYGTQDEIEEAA